ncbi:MAG: DNA-processing protein DprA [Planctomycetes bacterium]|nr:DNA-processing protein DprA [Planctomycetota bacterium]
MHDAYLMLALAEGFGESPCPALLQPGLDPEILLLAPPAPPDVPPAVARRLRQPDLPEQARAVRRRAEELGLRVLTPLHEDWPMHFDEQPTPPAVLFVRGDAAALQHAPAVAVVGSRTPTPYGVDAAHAIGAVLTRAGVVLWSGLARGIDAIAHRACLERSVPTVAVVAGSHDQLYPPEHRQLADELVAAGGCLVSELPPGRRARRGHFVRRNRLLAAGTAATVVVEASLASGALHTARFAAEFGGDVLCVPGPWRSERSQGCHRLIAEGAGIVEGPDALLQALGLLAPDPNTALRLEHGADDQAVLDALRAGPRPTDLLQRECRLDGPTFLRVCLRLEAQGAIRRLPGDLWSAGEG